MVHILIERSISRATMKKKVQELVNDLVTEYPITSGIHLLRDKKKKKKRIIKLDKTDNYLGYYNIRRIPSDKELMKLFSMQKNPDRSIRIDNLDFVVRLQICWQTALIYYLPSILKGYKEKEYPEIMDAVHRSSVEIIKLKHRIIEENDISRLILNHEKPFGIYQSYIFGLKHDNIDKVWKYLCSTKNSSMDAYKELQKIKKNLKRLVKNPGNDAVILNEILRYTMILTLNTDRCGNVLFIDVDKTLKKTDLADGIIKMENAISKNWKKRNENPIYDIFMMSNEMVDKKIPDYKRKLLFMMTDFMIWDKSIHSIITRNFM